MVEAPMVLAEGARAGLVLAASVLEFPAATYSIIVKGVALRHTVECTYGDVNSGIGELYSNFTSLLGAQEEIK